MWYAQVAAQNKIENDNQKIRLDNRLKKWYAQSAGLFQNDL
jgi:hypothetical protein